MAIAKVILNGEVQMDVTSDTVEANKLLEGETATKNDGTKVTGTFVAPDPVISSLSITPTESEQIFNEASISGYKPVTVGGISSTYIGSAVPLRSNADMYKSEYAVYAPSGYYSSEVFYTVPVDEHTAPTLNFDSNYGTIRAIHNATDTIRDNHILGGTSIMTSDRQLPTLAASTYIPTASNIVIDQYRWLTGSQTIAGDPNLVGSNIVSGISIFGVQGTYEGGGNTDRSGDIIEKTISGTYENSQIAYIGEYTFYSCRKLKNAVFLNATSAGSHAFDECLSLSTVSIPNLSIVEESMFRMCWNLTAADFPNVTRVRMNGFSSCNKLTTVSMPSVISVDYGAFAHCYSLSAIFFPNAKLIGVYAFGNCSNLTTVSLPSLTSIGANAFINCSNLDSISLSNISIITSSLFQSCYKLSIVDIPNAEKIYDSAFAFCSGLIVASFPNVTQMSSRAFAGCTNLTTAYFPKLSIISGYTFNGCKALITLSFPSVTTIYMYAFYSCNGLVNVEFPNVSVIGGGAFSNCGSLTTISFPQATDINDDAFRQCFNLTMVSFPKAVFIGTSAFTSCSVLSSVYLLGSSVVALSSTNAFLSTPIYNNGSIYVPTSLYASYIVASNWSRFSSQIVSLTDEEIAAL